MEIKKDAPMIIAKKAELILMFKKLDEYDDDGYQLSSVEWKEDKQKWQVVHAFEFSYPDGYGGYERDENYSINDYSWNELEVKHMYFNRVQELMKDDPTDTAYYLLGFYTGDILSMFEPHYLKSVSDALFEMLGEEAEDSSKADDIIKLHGEIHRINSRRFH